MTADRQTLASDIVAAAVLRGSFTLRSGQTSSYYIAKYRLTTEPRLLANIAAALAELLPGNVSKLAGTALGAVPLATAVSLQTGLSTVFVRVDAAKDHGTAKSIEGVLGATDRVALIEDVVTTGGASLAAVELLRAAGADVVTALAVVDREQGGREALAAAGVALQPLFSVSELGISE
jgi:orotate phosphoribosyltransferase